MGCSQSNDQTYQSIQVNAPSGSTRNQGSSQHGSSSGGRGSRGGRSTNASMQSRIQYLQNQKVETVIKDQMIGEGIKETPAYETPLSKHDLIKWRSEFWETRTQGSKHIWNLLKSACEEDPETANALILAAGLQMPQNSLTLVVDEQGMYYRLPLCVINEPLNFNADHLAKKLVDKQAPKEYIFKVSPPSPFPLQL